MGADMADFELNELLGLNWMQSRVPAQNALVGFVPDGQESAVDSFTMDCRSRWYPVRGGTRVVVSLETRPQYDSARWHIEKGARDHEHCDVCGQNIPAMTPCWVTKEDPYIQICDGCHSKVVAAGGKG